MIAAPMLCIADVIAHHRREAVAAVALGQTHAKTARAAVHPQGRRACEACAREAAQRALYHVAAMRALGARA